MPAIELYTQIQTALDNCVDAQVSQPTRARLALLVLGMAEQITFIMLVLSYLPNDEKLSRYEVF